MTKSGALLVSLFSRTMEILPQESRCWIAPIAHQAAETVIETLVARKKNFAFSERSPAKKIQSGDWLCFYAARIGIVGHCQVNSSPERKALDGVDPKYCWVITLDNVRAYLDEPLVLNDGVRDRLDALRSFKEPHKWAGFVQVAHSITLHDFRILTRQDRAE